jgi:UPF0755 protein
MNTDFLRPDCDADITALEAVINPEKNDFIYFFASVERFGYHEFAATLKAQCKC